MDEKLIENEHSLNLERRKNCSLTGVRDVVAFDEHVILLRTEMGELEILGEDLHVKEFASEKGRLELDGLVNSMEYREKGYHKQGDTFWKRLLR